MPVAVAIPEAVDTFKKRFTDRSTPPPEIPPFQYGNRFDHPVFGDWRDELATKGYTVVKAIPTERALQYRERAFEWLEEFPLGFDRNDVSTWTNEHLPVHVKGGMFHGYGFLLWDIRCEEGVIDTFAKVWGTDELITSFDGGSVMLPKRTDVADGGKWEHMDQSHHRTGFYCCQGLVNLNHNGPEDGGLMVLEGSSQLVEEHFNIHGRHSYKSWGPFDWYDICMAPASLLSEEDRKLRVDCFNKHKGTTHVPFAAIFAREHEPQKRSDGKPCALDTGIPRHPAKLNDRIAKLVGITPY
ncbi:hypothetical protein IAU60_006880 [Kwoniella sp. DSM 27419]